jgi:DNA polymerase III subunit beta
MSICINRKQLLSALDRLVKIIPTRPIHPTLEAVELFLDARKSLLVLRCFNLNQEITIALDNGSDVLQDTKIYTSAKKLKDTVRALSSENISLEVVEDKLNVGDGLNTFKLPLIDDELPEPEALVDPQQFSIDRKNLVEALESTIFATSPDETKQVLCGVNINASDLGLINFAATDGHRLAYISFGGEFLNLEGLTIPRKTCEELLRTLKKVSDSKILVAFTKEEILFTLVEVKTTLRSRLLVGQYPKYPSLIPTNVEYEAVANRLELLNIIQTASRVLDKKEFKPPLVTLYQEDGLKIDVLNNDRECVITQVVDCKGSLQKLAFNLYYLLEVLQTGTTKEIKIKQGKEPLSPVVIESNYNCLIMPVQLRN